MNLTSNKYLNKSIIILIIFFLDRVTKMYVLNTFENIELKQILVNNYINIYLIWNKGIAFGLLNFSNQIIYNIITLLIVAVSLIIVVLAIRTRNLTGYFFAIIFGGALGNLYDRIKYNAVPDFIDLHIGNYHWFIFNVADIFISIGVICLIFEELIFNKNDKKE
mgnify:FL=1